MYTAHRGLRHYELCKATGYATVKHLQVEPCLSDPIVLSPQSGECGGQEEAIWTPPRKSCTKPADGPYLLSAPEGPAQVTVLTEWLACIHGGHVMGHNPLVGLLKLPDGTSEQGSS